jgi:hypothetical protein
VEIDRLAYPSGGKDGNMESLQHEEVEPGTLLWIGPTAHPEFIDAFRFCSSSVAQLAVRKNLHQAIARPAGYVRRMIVARPTRQTPQRPIWDRFSAHYGHVPAIALCSTLCDGEGRTGTPWPASTAVRFSRWNEVLPAWLAPCGVRAPATSTKSSVLVVTDRFEMAEPYLLWADATGVTSCWHRSFMPGLHRSFGTVLWDDSSARPAAAETWRERLNEHPLSQRHLWLALQPSIEAIEQAIAGGIAAVLTKPVTTDAIFQVFHSPSAGRVRSS